MFSDLMEKKPREQDDVYDYAYSLRNSVKRLDESKILTSRDKELIRGFLEHLRAKRVSAGRLAKYAFTLRQLMEHLGVPIENAGRSLTAPIFPSLIHSPTACLETLQRAATSRILRSLPLIGIRN